MENVYITIAGLVAIGLVVYLVRRARRQDSTRTDLKITGVHIDPPSGSVLEANTPITVTLDYRYSAPREPLYVWVKILDTTYDSVYEGSRDCLEPGTGQVTRRVHLTQAGTVRELFIVAKNQEFVEVFNQALAVDYTYEQAEVDEEWLNDGKGSEITGVKVSIPSPAVVKAGTRIDVDVAYAINTEEGLDIWVIPETQANMTYEGTTGKQVGTGVVSKHFTVIDPGKLTSVRLLMKNAASQTVYERIVPVDYTYTAA
ncbi:hypothetical protein PMI14_07017 [Acidovorax sp. CF316]|uniref:hypothetical protein n=1 Tax=Acidovorax sp. CF316 TaxID=1144317 RepID=UPI00026BEF8B|nr:hypothetical protein [Acidovorax sp. CF316]EJE48562.1 hypothetical protein PMI14_07017 [Acidovorax sp. CF316]